MVKFKPQSEVTTLQSISEVKVRGGNKPKTAGEFVTIVQLNYLHYYSTVSSSLVKIII